MTSIDASDSPVASTGLLLLFYRRPDLTELLLSHLTIPENIDHIFLYVDGPPDDSSQDLIDKISNVKSLCEGFANSQRSCSVTFRNANLGCRDAILSSIDECFQSVYNLIILEDDCIPSASFIPFCLTHLPLLDLQRSVYSIIGSSYIPSFLRPSTGAFYSLYGDSCGWATNRTKWSQFYELPATYDYQLFESSFLRAGMLPIERRYWHSILLHQYSKQWAGVWDYQWFVSVILTQGVHLVSAVPLISNRGYRSDATHTNHFSFFASQSLHHKLISSKPSTPARSRFLDFIIFCFRRQGFLFFLRAYLYPVYITYVLLCKAPKYLPSLFSRI